MLRRHQVTKGKATASFALPLNQPLFTDTATTERTIKANFRGLKAGRMLKMP